MTSPDSMPAETQRCSRCKAVLPLAAFHRNRAKPRGLQTECKPCIGILNANRPKRPWKPKPGKTPSVLPWHLPIEQRIEGLIERVPFSGCWIWTGRLINTGYAFVTYRGKRRMAHRLSWELRHGAAMPSHMLGCHTCDVPCCVNPDHIWPGTKRENFMDAVTKGRISPLNLPKHMKP